MVCGPVGLVAVVSKNCVTLFAANGLNNSWLTPVRPVWESVNMIGSSVFFDVARQLTSVSVGFAP